MSEQEIEKIVGTLAKSLELRDYEAFVNLFADNATFEIPFSGRNGKKLEGLPKIREHFDQIAKSPFTKLIRINSVTAKFHYDAKKYSAMIEYYTSGTVVKSGEEFNIQSSVALIQVSEGKIIHYRDFPNTSTLMELVK